MTTTTTYSHGDIVKVRSFWGTCTATVISEEITEGWDNEDRCWVYDHVVVVHTTDKRCPYDTGKMAVDVKRVKMAKGA